MTFEKERDNKIFVCDEKLLMNMVIKTNMIVWRNWKEKHLTEQTHRNSLKSCLRVSIAGLQVASNRFCTQSKAVASGGSVNTPYHISRQKGINAHL